MAREMQSPQIPVNTDLRSNLTASSTRARLLGISSPYLIVLVAATVRGLELLGFEGTINDGTSRVHLAAAWIFRARPLFGRTDWPLGNYILPAIALFSWNDPYWSVRILYTLVGVSNVLLTYLLAKELGGRKAAAVAAWIVALVPYHIVMSANGAMSEGPYITSILLALLFTVKYSARSSAWMAAAAGIAITVATMFRFDGIVWGLPIAGSIALFAWHNRRSPGNCLRDLSLLAVFGLVFPAALLFQWMTLYHDPLYTFHRAAANTLQFFANGSDGRWPRWFYQIYVTGFWPASTFVLLSPLVAALGWVGVIRTVRERRLAATPLILGGLIVTGFLSFAALRHEILAQWRYSLILVIVLSSFCSAGVEAISRASNRITEARIWVTVITVAVAWQGVISYFAFSNHGVFTRQFGMLSPLQPDQYGSRGLITWMDHLPSGSGCVVLTPHVLEQPYLDAHLPELERSHGIIAQSYYRDSEFVFSGDSLIHQLRRDLSKCQYVITSASLRRLGLKDGLYGELIRPKIVSGGDYAWSNFDLRFEHRYGSNLVWRINLPHS